MKTFKNKNKLFKGKHILRIKTNCLNEKHILRIKNNCLKENI